MNLKNKNMKYLFTIITLIFTLVNLSAQQPTPIQIQVPPAGSANFNDTEDGPWYVTVENREAGQHLNDNEKMVLQQMKAETNQQFPYKKSANDAVLRTQPDPVINSTFIANSASGSVPMDNYMAISDSGMITSVSNTIVQVYNEGGTLIKSRTLQSFSSVLALNGVNNGKFDPKVIYDPEADRFIAVILNGFNSFYSKIIVAFSTTNRPDSTWNFYTLSGNPVADTTWFDYPAISITHDELFITGNQLREGQSWLLGFNQSIIWQIDKSDGYNGDTLTTNLWTDINSGGRPIRNLHPVKWGENIEGPKQYFLSNRNISTLNDTIFVLSINDTIGAPGLALSVDVLQSDIPYGFPPNAFQKVAGQYLATNDGRVLGGFYQNGRIYFASNSVDTANGRAGIYFGEITGVDVASYNITGTMISNDTLDFGYPNLSWCGYYGTASDLYLSFLHSGPNRFPGISTLFYSNGDWSNLKTVKEGIANLLALTDSVERWGDYFGSQQKYNNNGVVWICGTYGNTGNFYRAQIAELYNPHGIEIGIEENNVKPDLGKVYPNPSLDLTNVEINIPTDKNVVMEIFDMQGKSLGTVFKGLLYAGNNKVQFNIGHLSPGTYILTVSSGNESLLKQTIIKH